MKVIKFCLKIVCPGLFIAIFIIYIVNLEGISSQFLGIAWISVVASIFALSYFEGLVEGIITKHEHDRFIKEEDSWWREHPRGKRATITDKKTGEVIGTILNEQLRFLIDVFTEEQMEENDFCFINELFDLFIKEKKPDLVLREFIRNALRDKDEIILHWEKE